MAPRLLLALAVLSGAACVPQRETPQDLQRERVARLAAEVQAAEDVSAIKRLQRTYGYFLDKGLWTDLADYFTEDAVANYPAGVFIGRESIRQHLYRNVGGVPVGQVGLPEGRLYNHMSIQPVIHLDPGGNSAKGRWRALAMFGSFGSNATWAEGIYEMQYRKVDGTWKISRLDYHAGFSASYETGWVAPAESSAENAASRARRQLAHPPDRERNMEGGGFPAACLAPFHYGNPGTPAGGHVWGKLQPAYAAAQFGGLAQLARRAERLHDEQQIENLQRIYGYYLDRAQWDQVADLFADEGVIEFGQQGVYHGRRRIREFLGTLGPHGLQAGWLNDHLQLQPVVTVIEDPRSGLVTARIRSRELGMTGHVGGKGQWSEGIYENWLVRENGIWKFSVVRFYPTFITDYDAGWAKDAQPAPGPSSVLPPDAPPSQRYAIYPKAHVPPFHYLNPVSGEPVTYPAHAAVAAAASPAVDKPTLPWIMPRQEAVRDPAATLAHAEQLVARVKDYHEIENLGSAYGYYLDKNLFNPLADLFARNGSIELAQRGVYRGRNVREFLLKVFGRSGEGPVAGRLANHIQVQPVTHVSDDGRTASVRSRMLQHMSTGGRASLGGAIYANELVKEEGVWKFSKVHAYNTFSAGYDGGWARAASRGMPGPSADVKPDAPPGTSVHMLPIVYEIPYHYANPVSGRRELPPLPVLAAQLSQFPLPPAARHAGRHCHSPARDRPAHRGPADGGALCTIACRSEARGRRAEEGSGLWASRAPPGRCLPAKGSWRATTHGGVRARRRVHARREEHRRAVHLRQHRLLGCGEWPGGHHHQLSPGPGVPVSRGCRRSGARGGMVAFTGGCLGCGPGAHLPLGAFRRRRACGGLPGAHPAAGAGRCDPYLGNL